ncbi:MAG: cobyric acid synthase, partial [Janibacter sp.]|nr:cobyric acid synthase [Janibacter sp.]
MSGLLITGTSSDAGKSLVVTGLCRVIARRGISVAPYKAQNMSNHSMVCRDGSEIGRAQYLQAQAAGVEATSAMNPVLLKPGSDRRAHVVVRGRPAGELMAGEYTTGRRHLAEAAFTAYEELAARHEVIVCEGAGSPAEINLRAGDYVNLGLAQRFSLPTVLVGDIDRGGVLAALYGTWALVAEEDRPLLRAYLINKFRGDASVLEPGLVEISRRTGMPSLGVLPWLQDVWLDSEDSLSMGAWGDVADGVPTDRRLAVAVVRLPRTSNGTDVDALAAEPGVDVRVTVDADHAREADLLVLPGSRATTSDLEWLRRTG